MSAISAINESAAVERTGVARGIDAPRFTPNTSQRESQKGISEGLRSVQHCAARNQMECAAVARRGAQLPAFSPLLEELEISGWSSHRRMLSGNFHDWLLLEGRRVLVIVGQTGGEEPTDSTEAALVAQAAWATIRAHAHYEQDAGDLLSIASRSLWATQNCSVQASVAVAVLDTHEGSASLAVAGDCLAWRVRAAHAEQLAFRQPRLGEATDFTYTSRTLRLALRERLLLVADNPPHRPAQLAASITRSFASLNAESHRRMLAADALTHVRRHYENAGFEQRTAASIVAVRRR